jgi:NAD+ synthase (glutamine-hydrolysing)
MKIALAQLNFHVGHFPANVEKIINAINTAKLQGVELIIFSELSVCGYSPLDMLDYKSFIEKCEKSVKEIANHCDSIAAIVGSPVLNKQNKGKSLFNSALFLYQKKVQDVFHKTLLPTYDIFDEYRHFEPNTEFKLLDFKGEKIAITICEDLWDEQKKNADFDREMMYKSSPLNRLSELNPDFVVNISGSPFSYHQVQTRKELLIKNALKYKLPIVYVNQVGANTDLIFDGGSFVINKKGKTVAVCKYFSEDFVIFDTNDIGTKKTQDIIEPKGMHAINSALVCGIRDFFEKNGFTKAVLGLSGGIDSALVLALAVQALGNDNIDVLLMPSAFSSKHSVDDSIDMAERCRVNYHIVSIEEARLEAERSLSEVFEGTIPCVSEENIQARLRGLLLMAFSNKFGNILLNTSNKSEAAVGYTTLYGDMNGALSVIGDLYKTEVYQLAKYINSHVAPIIPENIINKEPSAELRPNQKDSDSLPEYEVLDSILFNYIERRLTANDIINMGYDSETVSNVLKLVNSSEYKRFQAPPILRVSTKAFGFGRRMPLVARYFK